MVLKQPTTPDFNNPATRVRINPQMSLVFDGDDHVTLHHRQSQTSMRFKYDILLVLYPMVEWTTVGQLCEAWPPPDQEKIKQHLTMMYQVHLIVTDESEIAGEPDSPGGLPANLGDRITINVENHHAMLRDSIRMACYRRAIEKAVTANSVVMDLGAGSGILSFFAAKAGARKVYAVEKRPDMVMLATELAKANSLDKVIEFVQNSSHLIQPETLSPRPDLLVAEILGNAILEENVLEFTMDVRDRLLAPGARMIPEGLEIMAAAFDSGASYDRAPEVDELAEIYGLNFDMLKTVLSQKPTMKLERFNPAAYTMMSDPASVIHIDFAKLDAPTFTQKFSYKARQDGHINGVCAYFKAHLDGETVLTNSPWAPPTHWTQVVFHFPDRRAVSAGETVTMEMTYDGGLSLWFAEPDTP